MKRCESLFASSLKVQRQPEVVERFAVMGIRITPCQPLYGTTKMRFGLRKLAPSKVRQPQSIVAAHVQWITTQAFFPVGFRRTRSVAILFQVKSGQIQFFDGRDFSWRRRLGGGIRQMDFMFALRLIANEFLSISREDAQ